MAVLQKQATVLKKS